MIKAMWMTLVTLLGLAVLTSPAMAQGHEHDKDKNKFAKIEHRDAGHDRDRDHDRDRSYRHDRDRDDHVRGVSGHPQGWSQGRKKGWGDCDVPPGQAKKQGCHPYSRHDSYHAHHTVRTRTTKPVVMPRPAAEVHAHAGVDAKVH